MSNSSFNPEYNRIATSAPSEPTAPPHSDSDSDDEDHKGEQHKHCAKARAELTRYGFPPSHKAQIAIALDVSASMQNPNGFYTTTPDKPSKIQRLIEKAMAMAIELSPDAKHTVTIFPFGEQAFAPVVIDEHHLKNAVNKVWQSIGCNLSLGTNYNVVAKAIRKHYFKTNDKLLKPCASDKAPVFCLFVTDGEPRAEVDEARSQFNWSEYNAIFFKFIALKGKQKDLEFQTLKIICERTKQTYLPNKHLIVLKDPDNLSIKKLFENYRLWVKEAFEHKILANNPGIKYNKNNPNDIKEMQASDSLKQVHGHDDDDDDEENHASPTSNRLHNPNSNQKFLLILGLIGAVTTPFVVSTTLPLWLMVGIGFGFGIAAGTLYNTIYDCLFPTTANYPGYGSSNSHHADDSDDDDEEKEDNVSSHHSQHQLLSSVGSLSHYSSSTQPPVLQYQQYQPLKHIQYQPYLPPQSNSSGNDGNPSYPPPPYPFNRS